MDKDLEYFFRYCNDELTEDEKKEEKKTAEKNKNRKITDNQYASCIHYEDDLELSLDTH
jgi:hypothetical protein